MAPYQAVYLLQYTYSICTLQYASHVIKGQVSVYQKSKVTYLLIIFDILLVIKVEYALDPMSMIKVFSFFYLLSII